MLIEILFDGCLGKATANSVWQVTDVRLQVVSRGVPLLGRADEVGEVHTRHRSVYSMHRRNPWLLRLYYTA